VQIEKAEACQGERDKAKGGGGAQKGRRTTNGLVNGGTKKATHVFDPEKSVQMQRESSFGNMRVCLTHCGTRSRTLVFEDDHWFLASG
jgi:hypothetical protein